MAPKSSRSSSRKQTNQQSILQMPGFRQHPSCDKQNDLNDNDIMDESTKFADGVADRTRELNVEHERITQARKIWRECWLDDHDWLRFNYDVGRAFCIYCQQDPKCRSAFGKEGATNLRTSAFREHAESDQHKHARWVMKGGGKDSLLKVDKQRMHSIDKQVLTLFMAAYFIGKEDLAYRKIGGLLHLLRAVGVDVSTFYNDDKACSRFLKCMSASLETKIFEKIKLSPWFGVMVDESTDVSVTKTLILYANYLDDFQPRRAFLGLLHLDEADAATITAAIVKRLDEGKLDMQKMMGFGSDGASVMVGRRTGVAARLKKKQPYLTSIHCVAHRTNLCVESVGKHASCKELSQKIDTLVNGTASYFSASSLRGKLLADLERELAYSTLRLESISNTRWLSRHHAIHKLCEVFEPVMEALQQNASWLFDELKEFKIVYTLHFLADILRHLTLLSADFQRDYVDATMISSLVNPTKVQIEMDFLNETAALDLNGFLRDSKGYPVIPEFGGPNGQLAALRGAVKGDMYRSIQMNRSIDGEDLFEAIEFQKQFAQRVLDALDERFAERDILSCFKVLTPAHIPKQARQLESYGQKEMNDLLKFYGEPRHVEGVKIDAIIDADKFRMEYRKFKIQASTEWQGKNFMDTWSIILSEKFYREDKYAEMSKLAAVAMVQCASTAICERGFSQMNHIKDKYRNPLKVVSVDTLLRVAIEGPSMEKFANEFDFEDSISIWRSKAKYRHIYSGASSSKRTRTIEENKDTDDNDEDLI